MSYRIITMVDSSGGIYEQPHEIMQIVNGEATAEFSTKAAAIEHAQWMRRPAVVHCPDGSEISVGADGEIYA